MDRAVLILLIYSVWNYVADGLQLHLQQLQSRSGWVVGLTTLVVLNFQGDSRVCIIDS